MKRERATLQTLTSKRDAVERGLVLRERVNRRYEMKLFDAALLFRESRISEFVKYI